MHLCYTCEGNCQILSEPLVLVVISFPTGPGSYFPSHQSHQSWLEPPVLAVSPPSLVSENTISSESPFCQTWVGLSTRSMFGRALHGQPRVVSPQHQEQAGGPTGVWHLYKWKFESRPTARSHNIDSLNFKLRVSNPISKYIESCVEP